MLTFEFMINIDLQFLVLQILQNMQPTKPRHNPQYRYKRLLNSDVFTLVKDETEEWRFN